MILGKQSLAHPNLTFTLPQHVLPHLTKLTSYQSNGMSPNQLQGILLHNIQMFNQVRQYPIRYPAYTNDYLEIRKKYRNVIEAYHQCIFHIISSYIILGPLFVSNILKACKLVQYLAKKCIYFLTRTNFVQLQCVCKLSAVFCAVRIFKRPLFLKKILDNLDIQNTPLVWLWDNIFTIYLYLHPLPMMH